MDAIARAMKFGRHYDMKIDDLEGVPGDKEAL
jgi:hypothetical protein